MQYIRDEFITKTRIDGLEQVQQNSDLVQRAERRAFGEKSFFIVEILKSSVSRTMMQTSDDDDVPCTQGTSI